MIYIKKTQPPPQLDVFIESEKQSIADNYSEAQRQDKYPSFGSLKTEQKDILRTHLYKEQRGLCCYCMRVFDEKKISETKIEHFLPESAFLENQTDYFNLYLACHDIHGKSIKEQNCDTHKGDYLIPKFIGFYNRRTNQKCEDFFQYNSLGEILPKGSRKSYDKFCNQFKDLSLIEKSALIAIDVLNLNVNTLKAERKDFIDNLLKIIEKAPKENLIKMKEAYEKDFGRKFAGIVIYFVKGKLNELGN